jgi:DNA segregation ATPase FtsK/SpoIIIE-like protein
MDTLQDGGGNASASKHTYDAPTFEENFSRLLADYLDSIRDRRKFSSLLRDIFPGQKRQVNLVLSLHEMGIADEIQSVSQIDGLFAARFEKRLMEEYGMAEDGARWAVRAWCVCYGKETLGKPCDAPAPEAGEPECIEFEDLPNGGAGEERPDAAADDPQLDRAIWVVMNTGTASASWLQRHLNIDYPRAERLISGLELLGIVGPQPTNSSRPREIFMDEDTALDALERRRNGKIL